MAYTTIDDPEAYFQVKAYSGTGSSLSPTFDGDTNMQPDLVWIKCRNDSESHRLYDSVRGADASDNNHLVTNDTSVESDDTNGLTAFGSDGFTLATGNPVNNGSNTYVAWC